MSTTARERSGITPGGGPPIVTINVNGDPVTIDQRTLTMSERQAIKRELSKLEYDADDLDALCATIWVVMRRTDSALTFDDVCSSLTLDSLSEATAGDESSPEG